MCQNGGAIEGRSTLFANIWHCILQAFCVAAAAQDDFMRLLKLHEGWKVCGWGDGQQRHLNLIICCTTSSMTRVMCTFISTTVLLHVVLPRETRCSRSDTSAEY